MQTIELTKAFIVRAEQELHSFLVSLNKLRNLFFRSYTTADLGLVSVVMEMVFLEIYRNSSENSNEYSDLKSILKEVEQDLIKISPGGAIIEYPENVPRDSPAKVTLTIRKGDETSDVFNKINGIVTKRIGYPVQFNHLVAALECQDGKSKVSESDNWAYKFLRYGLKYLQWRWTVAPAASKEIMVLNICVFRGGSEVPSSVRESVWPTFAQPRIVISVTESKKAVILNVVNNGWFISIVCGLLFLLLSLYFASP
jgi:hypothetical protein